MYYLRLYFVTHDLRTVQFWIRLQHMTGTFSSVTLKGFKITKSQTCQIQLAIMQKYSPEIYTAFRKIVAFCLQKPLLTHFGRHLALIAFTSPEWAALI